MEVQLLCSAAPRHPGPVLTLIPRSLQHLATRAAPCLFWEDQGLLNSCWGGLVSQKEIIMPCPEHISRETEWFFHFFLCHQ